VAALNVRNLDFMAFRGRRFLGADTKSFIAMTDKSHISVCLICA